ncbi:MAG TPA: hypothetical protein VMS08_06330 [Candidatus Saccharimonadia bacterium]|nr:hypothetical protein [Candidatus Saccharimonadia bacterium]
MPTTASWTDPTKNVDGSAIAAGEITGYTVGARIVAGTAAGTYAYSVTVPSTATSEPLSLLLPVLPTGVPLAAAVKANTATTASAWSTEATFTLPAAIPVPQPPSAFSVS